MTDFLNRLPEKQKTLYNDMTEAEKIKFHKEVGLPYGKPEKVKTKKATDEELDAVMNYVKI